MMLQTKKNQFKTDSCKYTSTGIIAMLMKYVLKYMVMEMHIYKHENHSVMFIYGPN